MNLSLPSPTIHFHHRRSTTTTTPPHRYFRPRPLHRLRFSNFKFIRNSIGNHKLLEAEEAEFLIGTCIFRTLPPALTFQHGLDKLKDAVDDLKLSPPRCHTGMLRFQVLVSPSAKAFNWFCCLPESSRIFPQFFVSHNAELSTSVSPSLDRNRGVFGIGASVCFKGPFSYTSEGSSSFKRYFSLDSTLLTAYCCMDISPDSSYMAHETGLVHLFIPQLELIELDGLSVLSATLAWSDSSLCNFEEAVETCKLSLSQANHHSRNITEECHRNYISSTFSNPNVVNNNNTQMVFVNVLSLGVTDLLADPIKMVSPLSRKVLRAPIIFLPDFHQPLLFVVTWYASMDLYQLTHVTETSKAIRDCANINSLWASLIIEECSRLGLTYFCVAPGSRSSPLAIAASSHSLTTCVVCYDERSLAFHAIGYAKGSRKPAVVITSSGTAVSNLLPAVVEASQDFVPLVLLTADRPPELQDAGANQSINQVHHFSQFVRHFYGLPAPTDSVPARMVLTTLDSAVFWATSSPYGPVHINCPFREPLDNSNKKWMLSCLEGLDVWMTSGDPFTNYIQLQHSCSYNHAQGHMLEVLQVINGAKKGLLLLGAIHTEDDVWAVLLLAKHLLWPVVADILSGLRLRKYMSSFSDIRENFIFVDHLDHCLLSNAVKNWAHADVILQIGSRITSKRISQMLEDCFPCSYILVDKHPSRHDPLHIVTHRVQSSVAQFTECILKASVRGISSKWTGFLQAIDKMVSREISYLISSEHSLTEPYVANIILEALHCGSAIFVGNSMAIRDVDMYGCNWGKCTHNVMLLNSGLQCHGIQVSGNRGASGIDGLLSTAVGFAVGCNKRVICVVGDVSFLHDTNGLAVLKQRIPRKPVTVVVINNHGGAIFSLLPVADRVEQKVLEQFFYTSHNVSIQNLCVAHGVKHVHVHSKWELQDALVTSQHEDLDYVIEVESCIEANAVFHSKLKIFASKAADHSLKILSRLSISEPILQGFTYCKICKMEYSLYRIRLSAPPTSSPLSYNDTTFYREGFILTLSLENGSVGFGEVAPLEIHKEKLVDVEAQLLYLIHALERVNISFMLPLLKGSFTSWIWNSLGVLPDSIFPSVRCGIEMAILNALATAEGSSLLDILYPLPYIEDQTSPSLLKVQICALIDSNGTPAEVANIASDLVKEGFTALKLKVGRRADPCEDAAVIKEVRKKVGGQIALRADANQKWAYKDAIQFWSSVKDSGLQYIEEPVRHEDDLIKFCEETGLPVALDETIDNIRGNPLAALEKFRHPGIIAVVIKPSVVGGFENAAMIARWAQHQGKMTVVSAAFESGLGLSTYIQFSCYLDLQNADICKLMNKEPAVPVAHGLGTYRWLKEDVTHEPLSIGRNPYSGFMEASVADAGRLLQNFQINQNSIISKNTGERVHNYQFTVDLEGLSMSINVHEVEQTAADNVVVFLHGFLGTGEDWIPIMKAISGSARCVAVDLPGHGRSKTQYHAGKGPAEEPSFSIESVADILCKLLCSITPGKVTIVGYSMGARIALYMALRCSDKVDGAVIISGSPGLKDGLDRKIRKRKDDSRAYSLVAHGLEPFLDTWYAGELWNSLRGHPKFKQIVVSRLKHDDVHALAKVLSDLSVGRQPSLWGDLKHCKLPLLIIYGERDNKFKRIAHEICSARNSTVHETVEIPNSGHAAHLENPLSVVSAVRLFITRERV